MSFRFRRSKGLGKFARVTVSKTGVGMSIGTTGARISKHTSGRTTRTVGVPGTGAYYRKDTMSGRKRRPTAASTRRAAPLPAAPSLVRPGWLAPKADKALHRAMRHGDASALDAVADRYPSHARLAWTLAGAVSASDDPDGATRRFRHAHQGSWTTQETDYVARYLPHLVFDVNAAPGVDLGVPVTDLATVMCVRAAQGAGDHQGAADVAEYLDLADVGYRVVAVGAHHNAGNDDRVVELTNGITNTDNATMLLLTLRAGRVPPPTASRRVPRDPPRSPQVQGPGTGFAPHCPA